MSQDVIEARGSLRLYAPPIDLFEFVSRRRFRVAILYAGYLACITTFAILFEMLPPKYEVSAMIDLQPSTYAPDDQRARIPRADEMARSQIALLTTESVIRGALADVGPPPETVRPAPDEPRRPAAPGETPAGGGTPVAAHPDAAKPPARATERLAFMPLPEFARSAIDYLQQSSPLARAASGLTQAAAEAKDVLLPPLASADEAYVSAKRAIKAQAEPNTGFIRIAFQDRDAAYAAHFVNALIQRFTEKHYELYSNSAAVSFFATHRKESESEFSRASAALAAFSSANNIFDIQEQRRLLLQERSRVASELAAARSLRAQKDTEATTVAEQLVQMKPFSQYPQINALAQSARRLRPQMGGSDEPQADARDGAAASKLPNLTGDPPLLLVRVYQDTIAELVKLNTDIAGLQAKVKYQQVEIENVDRQLAELSAKEAAFDQLRQRVELAKASADQFAKKAVDEQIQQDLNAHKLSTVRIVQPPTQPVEPVWPRRLVVALALFLAAIPPLGFAGPAAYRRFAATRTG